MLKIKKSNDPYGPTFWRFYLKDEGDPVAPHESFWQQCSSMMFIGSGSDKDFLNFVKKNPQAFLEAVLGDTDNRSEHSGLSSFSMRWDSDSSVARRSGGKKRVRGAKKNKHKPRVVSRDELSGKPPKKRRKT